MIFNFFENHSQPLTLERHTLAIEGNLFDILNLLLFSIFMSRMNLWT